MRKIYAGAFFLLLLVSCQNNRKNQVQQGDVTSPDTIALLLPADSLGSERSDFRNGNELFDDFIFHFSFDENFQRNHIEFPLPYVDLGRRSSISQSNWEYDELFARNNYYTLIFDREKDIDLVSDTTLTAVQVEWLFFADQDVKRYQFNRNDGDWMLKGIVREKLTDRQQSGFIAFFSKFSTDSLFQSAHVREPLVFVTTDPDDDFTIIETTLPLNQWHAFKPELPVTRMSNFNYGQQLNNNSNNKIVVLKGIGNGFANTLYFKRKGDSWELYKFEDTSN